MSDSNQRANIADREWILAELARRDSGDASHPLRALNEADESTIQNIQAQLETLVTELRREPPVDDFAEESGCRLATELVEHIAVRDDFFTEQPDLEQIGPYQVVAKLSQGGMGAVYKAIHPKLKRTVAIKVLPASRLKDSAAVARFQREMQAIGGLAHRNIVAATDAGEVDGMHYLVMEYVDGLDLSTLVRRVGPLAPADACEITRQAALGLKEAHDRGIIHRDIKPSNLMLTNEGMPDADPIVKVLDFGLARLAPMHAEPDDLTVVGQIMGTLKYMAPEQCRSSRDVDARADIYSLGATLYRMLSGEAPFSAERFDSPLALVAALANESPTPLATRRGDLSRRLVTIVERMMAKTPADRFATPDDVIDALEPWSEGADLVGLLTRARGAEPLPAPPDMDMPSRAGASDASVVQLAKALRSSRLARAVWFAAGAFAILIAIVLLLNSRGTNDGETENIGASSDPIRQARRAAEWLVSQRAGMSVATAETGEVALKPGDKLPQRDFHLNSASLAGNQSITDEDLARFDSLPFFFSLTLTQTRIGDDGLRKLGSLPLLKVLYLSETRITNAGLEELRRYPQLTTLHLYGTAVTDEGLRHLAKLQNLNQIYLLRCSISDDGLKHLTQLKGLETLWLEETEVTAKGVAMLRLALPNCYIGSNVPASDIGAAVAAQQQSTSVNGVSDGPLERARDVARWLVPQLAKFEITTTGRGFVTLQPGEKLPGDFIQLIAANLDGNKALSNEDLARFDKLPLFTALSLGQTKIDDGGLRHLGVLPLLQQLYLTETHVADAGLKELQRFPKLEVLHLYGTQVTDAGLVHLAGNSMLVDLSLVGCGVSDAGLKHLTGLKRLRILALDRTGVTPRGIATIQLALPECEIRSDYNNQEIAEALESIREEAKRFEDQ